MRSRVSLVVASLAAFAATPALADIQINVDKTAQTLTVVARRHRCCIPGRSRPGASGASRRRADFRAFRMEKDHYSQEFDDAPMPNSIFFTKRGHAIHGSFDTKKLGRPASGGCVRLAPENAKVLFEMVKAEGVLKTKVTVSGDERVAIARADRNLTRGEPRGRPNAAPVCRRPIRRRRTRCRARASAMPRRRRSQPQYQQPQPAAILLRRLSVAAASSGQALSARRSRSPITRQPQYYQRAAIITS